MNTMTFSIYNSKKADVQKALDNLTKKAQRYNVPFAYAWGEEQVIFVPEEWALGRVYSEDHRPGINVQAVNLTITMMPICKDGYEVVGMAEDVGGHTTLLTPFTQEFAMSGFEVHGMYCEHCGTNRARKKVFIVRKGDELKQVGKTCLKDYCGIRPESIISFAEVADVIDTTNRTDFFSCGSSRIDEVWEAEEVLALACDAVRACGYTRSCEEGSTKRQVLDCLYNRDIPTNEGTAKAKAIVQWLTSNADSIRKNWDSPEAHALAIVEAGWASDRKVGYLAYMPVAYDKHLEKQRKLAEQAANSPSQYQGEVGKKLANVLMTGARCLCTMTNEYSYYGPDVSMYEMKDADGNIYIWKTSCEVEFPDTGFWLSGTVKEHSEFRGVKQTVLTRCKVKAA